MNDPIAPFETDDVLSSVRRLVTQAADGVGQVGQQPDKFLLTDALRVDGGAAEALNLAPYDRGFSDNHPPADPADPTVDTAADRGARGETVTDRMADLMDGMFGAKKPATAAAAENPTDQAPTKAEQSAVAQAGSGRVDLEWAKQVVRLLGDRRISPDKAIEMMEQRQDAPEASVQTSTSDDHLRALVREEMQAALQVGADTPLRQMIQREVALILADQQNT